MCKWKKGKACRAWNKIQIKKNKNVTKQQNINSHAQRKIRKMMSCSYKNFTDKC